MTIKGTLGPERPTPLAADCGASFHTLNDTAPGLGRLGMINGYSTPSDLGAYLTGRDAHAAMIALEAAAETINAALSLIKERVAEAG
jgi:hypothetical protein